MNFNASVSSFLHGDGGVGVYPPPPGYRPYAGGNSFSNSFLPAPYKRRI